MTDYTLPPPDAKFNWPAIEGAIEQPGEVGFYQETSMQSIVNDVRQRVLQDVYDSVFAIVYKCHANEQAKNLAFDITSEIRKMQFKAPQND